MPPFSSSYQTRNESRIIKLWLKKDFTLMIKTQCGRGIVLNIGHFTNGWKEGWGNHKNVKIRFVFIPEKAVSIRVVEVGCY